MMLRGFHFGKKFVDEVKKQQKFVDEIKEQQKEEEPIKAIKLTKLKCENCGSNLSLSNVVNGAIKCQYCGAEYVQGEVQKAEVMQEEDSLYADGDIVTRPISNSYVILNIDGKKRKFYITSTKTHRIYGGMMFMDGTIINESSDKLEIELIEI